MKAEYFLQLWCVISLFLVSFCLSAWEVDTPREGIWVLRNERGNWGGWSQGVAHQHNQEYQVRKLFDLQQLPAEARKNAQVARLQVYFGIQDYSWAKQGGGGNGLDEAFAVVVNGKTTMFETADQRFAGRAGPNDKLKMAWVEFELPNEIIQEEQLEVIFHKVIPPGKQEADDYIYPGIDNFVPTTSSFLSKDGGKNWATDALNLAGAKGEYMIRLMVADKPLNRQLVWQPNQLQDQGGMVAYAEQIDGNLRLEMRLETWNQNKEIQFSLLPTDHPQPQLWLISGKQVELKTIAPGKYELPPGQWEAEALIIPQVASLQQVKVEYEASAQQIELVQDICPLIKQPAGKRRIMKPVVTIGKDQAYLQNANLEAIFQLQPKFAITSLKIAELQTDILTQPQHCDLFRILINDKKYGCRDGKVKHVAAIDDGFVATLQIEEQAVEIDFGARLVDDELELSCQVRNVGTDLLRFHLAFPHLAGLQLSEDPADDHYLFPWGGGVIASRDCHLRTAYGENSAWWQMVDLFSPDRGGGVYLRADDPTALYKVIELRKGTRPGADCFVDAVGGGFLAPEMIWRQTLDAAGGLEFCFSYLRRDRAPQEEFAAPRVRLGSHSGDWHAAMEKYAAWSHQTWPRQPFPSRLTGRWTLYATGWNATSQPIYKDGAYVDDYINPRWDIAELSSWWSWSEVGPWNIPMDKLQQELGDTLFRRYRTYFQNYPGTDRPAYNLNRGDYDGYNPAWGGLPAFRKHLQKIKDSGQLAMLYTDPILASATTKMGSTYGPKYGIMNPRWDGFYKCAHTPEGYVGSYLSYNMCLDTEWYSARVAADMARVCRETGADGVRLDEYGHRGYVCESPHHQHLFAEPGHNAWLQALARNCRQVREAMDQVNQNLVLTTEFPGHDCMSAALDGAIVYDMKRINGVRPVQINLFRFYFPSCRTFEIDRPHTQGAEAAMLWNATATFSPGPAYPDKVLAVLREYAEVFDSTNMTPLVPTLTRRIYANQFQHGKMTVWTILNGVGHTVETPVLPVTEKQGVRYVDLLSGAELQPVDGALKLFMRRQECRLIAAIKQ